MPRPPTTHANPWPRFTLAPASGRVELAVGEMVQDGATRPERVTAALATMLDLVDGQPASAGLIRSLSMGSREWLLQQVAATCRPATDWFEAQCTGCGAIFDLTLDLTALPRSAPAPGFPVVQVDSPAGPLDFELANGFHEEALARSGVRGMDALRQLAVNCALFDDAETMAAGFDDATLSAIDIAFDAAAPDCPDRLDTECPACGLAQTARIEPLAYAFPSDVAVFRDVHVLGRAYQWSEAAILDLPTQRRKAYVGMVEAAGGRRA